MVMRTEEEIQYSPEVFECLVNLPNGWSLYKLSDGQYYWLHQVKLQ